MNQNAGKQPEHQKESEPSNQPAAVPVKINKMKAAWRFKKYKDEEFTPIEGCNEDYYISNYGRVVSCRTSNPREIYGFRMKKEKPESHKITLVRPGEVKAYHLTRLVYSHFCGELRPDQEVVILKKAKHLFYYKNLKAVSVPTTDKPSKQIAAKIPVEQAILNFKKYEDEEFKPIEGCNGDYYISNYGRVVSFRRHQAKEIFGYTLSKDKRKYRHIHLVQTSGPRDYFLAHLVYNHFCGELLQPGVVIIVKKSKHPFYYKNLKAIPISPAIKPSKSLIPPLAKIPKEQAILTFKRYEDEEFKPIGGFNGDYYISNYGRVVSFKQMPREIHIFHNKNSKNEHYRVSLQKQRLRRYYLLARLVYSHFCGELEPSMNVITLGKKRHPFYYKNLKAVPRAKGRYSPSPGYLKNLRSEITWNIPVLQFDLLGRFLREYPGVEKAAADLKIQPLGLYKCLRGKQKTASGFQWRYKMDPNFDEGICDIPPFIRTGRAVYQFSLAGTFIRSFPSITEAALETGEHHQYIYKSLYGDYKKDKYPYQYQWRYAHDPLFKKGIAALPPVNKKVNYYHQPVVKFTIDGDYVEQYSSIEEAAVRTGISSFMIVQCIRGVHRWVGNYRWQLLEKVSRAGKIEELPMIEHKNICQFDRDGKFLREYRSSIEAARSIGVSRTAIYLCIKGKIKVSAGFQWRARKQVCKNGKIIDIEPYDKPSLFKVQPVCQFDQEGRFIREYASIKEASLTTGIDRKYIYVCVSGRSKRAGGYQWRYRNDPLFANGISDIPPIRKKKKNFLF